MEKEYGEKAGERISHKRVIVQFANGDSHVLVMDCDPDTGMARVDRDKRRDPAFRP